MLADENVSQAVIELDDATKHAEEISKEISPQVDGQKNAHRVTFFVGQNRSCQAGRPCNTFFSINAAVGTVGICTTMAAWPSKILRFKKFPTSLQK
nr:hypothetical protein [Tanacetum cinerariifolium]